MTTQLLGRLFSSDEPELEFSGSSRAKLEWFQAKPSWGTLIFELNLKIFNSFIPQNKVFTHKNQEFKLTWTQIWDKKVLNQNTNVIVQ